MMARGQRPEGTDPATLAAASGEPFAGPAGGAPGRRFTFQVADGVPLYLALDADDGDRTARALASAWRTLGITRGDTVLIYDYGTSPITLFASWCFAPYLRRGAADLIGAVPVCNDGLPEFAGRALHVLRYLRPRITIIERALMTPFLRRAREEGEDSISRWTELLVVSSDEEAVGRSERGEWSHTLGVPVRLLLRAGAALFFAAECREGALHADPRGYDLEVVGPAAREGRGELCITTRFLMGTTVDRYLSPIRVEMAGERCPCGRPGRAFRCPP